MSQSPARPYIGGQAVIEGVMMRSPGSFAIVCRKRSGELVVREKPMATTAGGLRTWPLFRGIATVVESLRLGSRALRWSADIYEQGLNEEEAEAAAADDKPKNSARPSKGAGAGSSVTNIFTAASLSIAALAASDGAGAPPPFPEEKKGGGFAAAIPILFALGIFVFLPQAGAEGINKLFNLGLEVTSPAFQAITGGAKLLIVVSYLLAIRQIADIRRVFQYHGAEHKTISTYEANEDLVVDNARTKTTAHPRCGTTFLVMVALVSVVVFTVAGAFLQAAQILPKVENRFLENLVFLVFKLPFLPLVAAVTFELQRFFARYCTTGPLRVLLWPGFLVQKITTAEPDDAQLEVALASLRATLWREQAAHAPVREDRVFESYPALVSDPGYA
ncbi:MAG: DUF1385 domain-containing protein [Polyangiaceae bacterium]